MTLHILISSTRFDRKPTLSCVWRRRAEHHNSGFKCLGALGYNDTSTVQNRSALLGSGKPSTPSSKFSKTAFKPQRRPYFKDQIIPLSFLASSLEQERIYQIHLESWSYLKHRIGNS
ncbi:unnamed protein product [Protopolystoma xenopodis]|uniref:Uncharacterized protein n=1 Tax=Protopolystoma xenopodis TaxID=117903 RepID=A0A448WMI6_9PLAT|nr:unnamed protein product [Protopolystoma xenopodis]